MRHHEFVALEVLDAVLGRAQLRFAGNRVGVGHQLDIIHRGLDLLQLFHASSWFLVELSHTALGVAVLSEGASIRPVKHRLFSILLFQEVLVLVLEIALHQSVLSLALLVHLVGQHHRFHSILNAFQGVFPLVHLGRVE
jgi:hypothetical protein